MDYNACMNPPILITTSKQLDHAIEQLLTADALAVDTEFMREKTYFPKLCLLQIACKDEVFLIDPLQHKLDLRPLARIWSKQSIVKVFHSGAQDLQILFDACGVAPSPYFDTQDAAALIGMPEQVGYGVLVKRLLGKDLDKADRFTDWSRRPLDASQLRYAADDVIWLLQLYPLLVNKLRELGRDSWLDAEFSKRCSEDALTTDVRAVYLRLKRVSSLKPTQLAVAREVAAWRETCAMRKNIPKRWLLSDEAVLDIARRAPTSEEKLAKLRGVGPNLKRELGSLLVAVKAGRACPENEWPRLPQRPKLNADDSAALELMAAIVRVRAEQNLLSQSVLASRAQLEDYVSRRSNDCAVMQGWRKELVGVELERLLAGQIALRLDSGVLAIEEVADGVTTD